MKNVFFFFFFFFFLLKEQSRPSEPFWKTSTGVYPYRKEYATQGENSYLEDMTLIKKDEWMDVLQF